LALRRSGLITQMRETWTAHCLAFPMTPIGHSITGLAIGVAVAPRGMARGRWVGFLAAFALLANVPDLPLPRWGHDWYFFSHSLFVSLLFILAAGGIAALPRWRPWLGGWPVLLAGGGAWLSHLLLDSFYNRRLGIPLLWPVSDARLALGMPWFANLSQPGFNLHTARILAIEVTAYLPLLALAVGVRWMMGRMAAQSHAATCQEVADESRT
jgi:hypothetical protein